MKWRAVQIRRITKALEPGGGVCMGAPVKESCSIWTIVSRMSLDASRQTPLPFKHSGASSFTPAAAVRQGKKEQICF